MSSKMTITGGVTNSTGPNSVAISAPKVVQYPPPPPDTTGQYIALGSIIASFIDQLTSTPDKDLLDQSNTAEAQWSAHLGSDDDPPTTHTLHGLVKKLNLVSKNLWDEAENIENKYLEEAKCLVRDINTKTYIADYDGIYARAIEDMQKLITTKQSELCRTSDLQHTHLNQSTMVSIQHTAVRTVVGMVSKMSTVDYQHQKEVNEASRFSAVGLADKITEADSRLALQYYQVSGEALSSLMQNYAWLTTAYRTAAKEKGNAKGALGGEIVGLLALILTMNADLVIPPKTEKGCQE